MTGNPETKRRNITPLDEARAAVVLAQISERGTVLDDFLYEPFERRHLTQRLVDRALNLLAARGEIRLEPRRMQVVAVRVTGGGQ